MTDRGLLDRYVREGSQAAFSELAGRHTRMVYATCRRDLCDVHLAEDATQAVFILFAQKAKLLARDVSISGWLFTAARLVAKNAGRRESTRKRHEQEATPDMEAIAKSDEVWLGIEPWLNDALSSLQPSDRDVVLKRYFEGLTVRELAAEIGVAEDTVGKRIIRAIERMRRFLAGKEVPVTSVLLAAVLTKHATASVPPGLAASIAQAPSLPLPPMAEFAHSLHPTSAKGSSKMSMLKLTAVVCGFAMLATTATLLIRGHHRSAVYAAASSQAAGPVLLRYKFHQGDRCAYQITLDETGSVVVGAQTVPVHQQVQMMMNQNISSVDPDGSATATMQMTGMQVQVNGKPASMPAATATALGTAHTVRLSPTGEIKDNAVSSADSLSSNIWSSMELSGLLPDTPVSPGDTWQGTEKIPSMGMNATIPMTLTGFIHRNGHSIARINQTYNIKMIAAGQRQMDGTISGTGIEFFDNDLGFPTDNTMTMHLDGTGNLAPIGAPPVNGHLSMDMVERVTRAS